MPYIAYLDSLGDPSSLSWVFDPEWENSPIPSQYKGDIKEFWTQNEFNEKGVIHRKYFYNFPTIPVVSGSPVSLNPAYGNIWNHRCGFVTASNVYLAAVGRGTDISVVTSDTTMYKRYSFSDGYSSAFFSEWQIPLVSPQVYVERAKYFFSYTFSFKTASCKFKHTWYDSLGRVTFNEVQELVVRLSYFKKRYDPSGVVVQKYQADNAYYEAKRIARRYVDGFTFGQLTANAIENMATTDVNQLLFAKDLPELTKVVGSFRDLLTKRPTLTNVANAYLSYQYGIKPTISDVQRLSKQFLRVRKSYPKSRQTRSGKRIFVSEGAVSGSVERHCKIWYENNPLFYTFFDKFEDLVGIQSPARVIWDTIPFSFVADWFTNLSDVLDANQARAEFQKVIPKGGLYSEKFILSGQAHALCPGLPKNGRMSVQFYNRYWKSSLYAPQYTSLQLSTPSKSSLINGGALIIQRLR